MCVGGVSGKNTCATGNLSLSLSKECDSDPGMKVSVCVSTLCREAGALLLSTIMTDSKLYLFRGSCLQRPDLHYIIMHCSLEVHCSLQNGKSTLHYMTDVVVDDITTCKSTDFEIKIRLKLNAEKVA